MDVTFRRIFERLWGEGRHLGDYLQAQTETDPLWGTNCALLLETICGGLALALYSEDEVRIRAQLQNVRAFTAALQHAYGRKPVGEHPIPFRMWYAAVEKLPQTADLVQGEYRPNQYPYVDGWAKRIRVLRMGALPLTTFQQLFLEHEGKIYVIRPV